MLEPGQKNSVINFQTLIRKNKLNIVQVLPVDFKTFWVWLPLLMSDLWLLYGETCEIAGSYF
jgi:hypothetical protein